MIQRVQSILLVMVAITMSLIVIFPIFEKLDMETKEFVRLTAFDYSLYENKELKESFSAYAIVIAAFLSICIAFMELFSFKNRQMQLKLGVANTIVIVITLGLMTFYSFQASSLFNPEEGGSYKIAFYLPAVSLVLNRIATYYIKKDEELVRSADRLR